MKSPGLFHCRGSVLQRNSRRVQVERYEPGTQERFPRFAAIMHLASAHCMWLHVIASDGICGGPAGIRKALSAGTLCIMSAKRVAEASAVSQVRVSAEINRNQRKSNPKDLFAAILSPYQSGTLT